MRDLGPGQLCQFTILIVLIQEATKKGGFGKTIGSLSPQYFSDNFTYCDQFLEGQLCQLSNRLPFR